MKHIKTILITLFLIGTLSTLSAGIAKADSVGCQPINNFFGLVPWYAYFPPGDFNTENGTQPCGFHTSFATTTNNGQTVTGVNGSSLSIFWLVALAVFEDLLRVGGMVAVGMVIYGGVRYMTSAGSPDATKAGQTIILNALVGLTITIVAATTIQYLGTSVFNH